MRYYIYVIKLKFICFRVSPCEYIIMNFINKMFKIPSHFVEIYINNTDHKMMVTDVGST